MKNQNGVVCRQKILEKKKFISQKYFSMRKKIIYCVKRVLE